MKILMLNNELLKKLGLVHVTQKDQLKMVALEICNKTSQLCIKTMTLSSQGAIIFNKDLEDGLTQCMNNALINF